MAASVSSAVVQNYVNCYANSAIQALDFNHGFKFDKDKFKEGTKNIHSSALSAALTATASSTVMAAFGADWNNGRMGFTDATGRDLSFMGAYGKTAQNLAGMASGLSGQLVSAAMGNGFSMNILSSDDLGLGGNRTGLLSLTLGGDNSGFKFGSSAGWDISMSAIGNFVGSMDYLTTKMKDDKVAQFFLANNDSKEGMARLTYVNYGNLSGNTVATNIAQQIINGDKKLEFGISASDAGHYGHADVKNNTIQLNEKALEISRDNLGAVGGFTAMMAREGFLIDANKGLGTAEWSDEKMRETGAGAILTMAAFNVQKGAMDDIAKNLNIKYDGEWAGIKDKVDYVARTGDLSGFDATGRDFNFNALYYGAQALLPYAQRAGYAMLQGGRWAFDKVAGVAAWIGSEISFIPSLLRNAGQSAGGKLSAAVDSATQLVEQSTRVLQTYGPQMEQGPLPKGIIDTFRSGSYSLVEATKDITMYRVFSASPLTPMPDGKWWSFSQPTGAVQAMIDYAILPKWSNALQTAKAVIPKGTTFYVGRAAAQNGLAGGGLQAYIPNFNSFWLKK